MIALKTTSHNPLFFLFKIWIIRFLLGGITSLLVVGLFVFHLPISAWFLNTNITNSLVVMSAVYCLSFISLNSFSNYQGVLSLAYITPILMLWSSIGFAVLFLLRLSYSVYFLVFSTITMLMFFITIYYIGRRYGKLVVAYIADNNKEQLPNIDSVTWLALKKVPSIGEASFDMVMADLRSKLSSPWQMFLANCALNHVPVYHSRRLMELTLGRVKIDHLYENELGSLTPSKSYQTLKRIIDTTLVLMSLPVTLPIILVTALCIKIESKGNIFFIQKRIGQGGKIFYVYKFRSMYQDSEKSGAQFAQINDTRITRVGRFIRKVRIDELPQFFNVLKGEMSLIGPRPEQEAFVNSFEKEIPFYNYRHIVKPGISGWSQVIYGYTSGTDDTTIKLEYDFYYIKNISFSLDMLIFLKTIKAVVTGFGSR